MIGVRSTCPSRLAASDGESHREQAAKRACTPQTNHVNVSGEVQRCWALDLMIGSLRIEHLLLETHQSFLITQRKDEASLPRQR